MLYFVNMMINRLFFGGHWCINVEAIWLIKESKQFNSVIRALTYLDGMLSGCGMYRVEVDEDQVATLKALFDFAVGRRVQMKQDEYIYSVFQCFIQHKTHIYLKFKNLQDYNQKMLDLFMYPLHKAVSHQEKVRNFANLFKPDLLRIFRKVKTMSIDSLVNSYPFSLWSLSSLIKSSSVHKIEIAGGFWIKAIWSSQSKSLIKRKYSKANYDIKIEKITKFEYNCIIEKQA